MKSKLFITMLISALLLVGCASSSTNENDMYTFINKSSYTIEIKTYDKYFNSIKITLQPEEFYTNQFKHPIDSPGIPVPYELNTHKKNVEEVRSHATRSITFTDRETPLIDEYEYIFKNDSTQTLIIDTYDKITTLPPNSSSTIKKRSSILSAWSPIHFTFKTENGKKTLEGDNDNDKVVFERDHDIRTITFYDTQSSLAYKYNYMFRNDSDYEVTVDSGDGNMTSLLPGDSALIKQKYSITKYSNPFSYSSESGRVGLMKDIDAKTMIFINSDKPPFVEEALLDEYSYVFRNDSDYEVTVDSGDGNMTSLLPGDSALIKQKYPVTKYSNPFSYSSESGRVGLMKDIDAKTMIFINSDKPPFVEEALLDEYSYVFRNDSDYEVTVDSGDGNMTSLLPGDSALIKQKYPVTKYSNPFSYSSESGRVGLMKDIDAKTMIFINAYNPTIDVEDLASNQVLFKNKSDYPLTVHIAGDDNTIPLNSGDSFLFDIPPRYTFSSLDYIFKEVKGRVGSREDSKNKTISFINSDKPPFVEEALLDKYSYVFSNDSSYVVKIDSGNGNITSLLPGDSALIKQKYTIDKWTQPLPFSYTEYDGKVVQSQDLDMKIFTYSDTPRSTPSAIFVNNTDYTLKVSLKSVKKTIEVPKRGTYEVYYTSPLYNGISYYPTSFGSHAFKSSVSGNTVTFNQWIPEVEYRITGTAKSVNVTLNNESGGTSQYSNISLPYSFTYDNFYDDWLFLYAQNNGDYGSVKVSIFKNGMLYKTTSSYGAYVIATVSGRK